VKDLYQLLLHFVQPCLLLLSLSLRQVVFSFRLEAESTILVTAEDADMILYTARKTRLEEREPDDLLDAFR
jgi:hypothetical protein